MKTYSEKIRHEIYSKQSRLTYYEINNAIRLRKQIEQMDARLHKISKNKRKLTRFNKSDKLLSMNKTSWILKNGSVKTDHASFPFAFRAMYQIVKQGIEKGKRIGEMTKELSIISPLKVYGENRAYSYYEASKMATDQGLLLSNGEINSREFKNR